MVRPPAPSSARAVVAITECDRQKWHEQRCAAIRESWERQRRNLVARAFNPPRGFEDWARCEVRVSLPKPKP